MVFCCSAMSLSWLTLVRTSPSAASVLCRSRAGCAASAAQLELFDHRTNRQIAEDARVEIRDAGDVELPVDRRTTTRLTRE